MKKEYMGFMAVLAIVAAVAFYGGVRFNQYQAQDKSTAQFGQPGGRNFQTGVTGFNRGQGGQVGRVGSGAVMGEIIKKDKDSITVQLGNNGGTKIVFVPSSTNVVKSVEATSTDMVVGKAVVVSGKANPDGSVIAQSIQLRDKLPLGGINSDRNNRP